MKLPAIREVLKRPLARVLVGALGIAILVEAIVHAGAEQVLQQLERSFSLLPELVILEAGVMACNTLALRQLYGAVRHAINAATWVRAALLGFAVSMVVPLGRASAEATRALILTPAVGGPTAAVRAVEMQGIALLANAAISLVALAAAASWLGAVHVTAFIGANALVALVIGAGILLARTVRPGRLLEKVVTRTRGFGTAFDSAPGAAHSTRLLALAWEAGGRGLQVVQTWLVLRTLATKVTLAKALSVLGIHLVGQSLGDAVPAQLGASEATLVMSAKALALDPAQAASVGVLVHLAQLVLAVLCALAVFFFPFGRAAPARVAEASR